jgi:hypothetical protein
MTHRNALIAGTVLGLFPVAILRYDGYWDAQQALFIWMSFTVTGWLLVRRRREVHDSRWMVLPVLLVLGSAQFGIHSGLPLPADLSIAVSFLVLGVGCAGTMIGIEISHRSPVESRPTSTVTE